MMQETVVKETRATETYQRNDDSGEPPIKISVLKILCLAVVVEGMQFVAAKMDGLSRIRVERVGLRAFSEITKRAKSL